MLPIKHTEYRQKWMTIKHTECRQSHMLFNRNSWRILNITCSQLTNISFLFIKKQMTAEFIPTLLKNSDWNSNRSSYEKSSWALTLNQNSLIQEKRKKINVNWGRKCVIDRCPTTSGQDCFFYCSLIIVAYKTYWV